MLGLRQHRVRQFFATPSVGPGFDRLVDCLCAKAGLSAFGARQGPTARFDRTPRRSPRRENAIAVGKPTHGLSHPDHLAHDLVAGNDAAAVDRQVSFADVKIGAAHAAGHDAHEQLVVCWRGDVPLDEAQRRVLNRSRMVKFPGKHDVG